MKKFKKILRVTIPIAISLVIVASVVIAMITSSTYQDSEILYFQKLQTRTLSTGLSCNGKVEAENSQPVYNSLKTLKAEKVYVSEGDYVSKGQLLCKYNLKDVSENIEQINKNISELKNNSNSLTSQLNTQYSSAKKIRETKLNQIDNLIADYTEKYNSAKSEYEYYNNLRNESSEYANRADQYYNNLLKWKRSIEEQKSLYDKTDISTQSELDAIEYQIEKAKLTSSTDSLEFQLSVYNQQIENAEIVANCDGVVKQINVIEGKEGISDIAFIISDPESLIIKSEIQTQNINNVLPDNSAIVTYMGNNGNIEYNGIVKDIKYDKDSSTGFSAIISVEDADANLMIGMDLSVYIYTNRTDDVLSVAYDSISSNDEEHYYVYVANEQDNNTYKISKVDVEIGIESDYYIQIKSDKLKTGDNIICTPSKFTEGQVISDELLKDIEIWFELEM